LPITQYKGPTQQQRIVLLSLRSATRDLTHLPNVAPSEFEEILIKHHTNPQAWFMGQVLKLLSGLTYKGSGFNTDTTLSNEIFLN